jgi:hypothetical protein
VIEQGNSRRVAQQAVGRRNAAVIRSNRPPEDIDPNRPAAPRVKPVQDDRLAAIEIGMAFERIEMSGHALVGDLIQFALERIAVAVGPNGDRQGVTPSDVKGEAVDCLELAESDRVLPQKKGVVSAASFYRPVDEQQHRASLPGAFLLMGFQGFHTFEVAIPFARIEGGEDAVLVGEHEAVL